MIKAMTMLMLFVIGSTSIWANNDRMIGTNVIHISRGEPSLNLECRIKHDSPLSFEISWVRDQNKLKDNKIYAWDKLVWEVHVDLLNLSFRRYLSENGIQGFNIGPVLGLMDFKATLTETTVPTYVGMPSSSLSPVYTKYDGRKLFLVPGVQGGYKWILPFNITFVANAELSVLDGQFSIHGNEYRDLNKTSINAGAIIGFSF